MSEEQKRINEAISAWFEPKPPFKTEHFYLTENGVIRSAKSYWAVRTDGPDGWSSAIDFFTSEKANAMLLEAMPYGRISRDKDKWFTESDWRHFHTESMHADRKTAVVLAFCKFAGIEATNVR